MENSTIKGVALKGGEFLIKDIQAQETFIPEDYSEDQLMIRDMVSDFVKTKIHPQIDQLEKLDLELTCKLLDEAGELGLLGTAIPEKFGGSQQDFITNMLLTEGLGPSGSFALSQGAHTGIGTLPILYFGTPEQKAKYLPKLVTGELKACYCLTEPGSGSDALAAKTKAILSEDGTHYVLNGQKMWITNAGFADIFVVFAKIDGDKFTGFIVEKDFGGVKPAAEEEKMGIKGSSTRQVFLENVKVPVENVLGEIGKGHRIAFNILNIGRIKLAAGVVGGSKMISTLSIKYANERHQFQKPISSFGAIQTKLAEQAVRIFAAESATYRASHDIQNKEEALLAEGKEFSEALLGAAQEFAIECAIMKVAGSEVLDYCADEGVQIYGGMGYSEEAPMARAYRDSRINRIFEGTSEINRMLSVDQLLKRAMKGELDLMTAVLNVQKELMSWAAGNKPNGVEMAREQKMIHNMKKMALIVIGATVQKFMKSLEDEQELLMSMADMLIDIYMSESVWLRVEKLKPRMSAEESQVYQDMMQVYVDDAIERVALAGKRSVCSWAEGEELMMLVKGVRFLTRYEPVNSKDARRRIAAKLIEANEYPF